MKNLKQQLIRLGEEHPRLREHLRPILNELSFDRVSSRGMRFLATVVVDYDLPTPEQKQKVREHLTGQRFDFPRNASTVGTFTVTEVDPDDSGFVFSVEADVDPEYLSYDVDAYVEDHLVSMDHDATELADDLAEQVALDALKKVHQEVTELDPQFRSSRRQLSWWGSERATKQKIREMLNQNLEEIKQRDQRLY